jgi:hypothetical protein
MVCHPGEFSMVRSQLKSARALQLSGMALAVFVGLLQVSLCASREPPAATKTISLNSLSLEISALQALRQFNFDKEQLEKIQQWSDETVQKDAPRKPGKASKDCRDKMLALRKALRDPKDDESIERLNDELQAIRDKEQPFVDDNVELTDTAVKRSAELYRLLKPSQLALYLSSIAEDVTDPLDRLMDAMEQVRDLNDQEWKEQGGKIAEEIGRMLVGLEAAKSKGSGEQALSLLTRARGLAKEQFEKQQGELEKAARKIVGDASAEAVLRHHVQLDLASLLSNPQLPQASRALVKSLVESSQETKRQ